MSFSSVGRSSCLSLILVVLCAGMAGAQGSEDVNAGQFDFSLPGARSLAMGGAFVALADDATSAYSNPAGLTLLGRPEISVEFRGWSFAATAIDQGHAFGSPTGIGLDTVPGVVEKQFDSNTSGVSFLSAVFPRDRWAVGFFRHAFPKFETRKEISGAFFDCRGGFIDQPPESGTVPFCSGFSEGTGGVDRILPKEQQVSIDVSSWGLTFAYKVTDGLSLGISGLYYDFSINSVNRVFNVSQDPFGARDPEKYDITGVQKGEDNAFGVNVGARWEISEKWILGGSYRQGPNFKYVSDVLAGTTLPNPEGCQNGVCTSVEVPFRVPDTYAIGLAFRPMPVWTIMFQYDLVQFADLLNDNEQTSGLLGNAARVVEEGLKINNAHRLRLGFEYLFLFSGGNVFAVRGGVWHDSAHRAFFEADPETGSPFPRFALLFPEGRSLTHGTAGVGLVLQPRFQIDAGFDYSELRKTASISVLWKF